MTDERETSHAGLTEAEMTTNVIRLVFGNDTSRYEMFLDRLRRALPPDAAAVLRGSAVTGVRWDDGAPFDADGPGTSDVDLTLVGGDALDWFDSEGFYIPAVHTKPLGEEHPDIAPALVPLRNELTAMVGRPVNIQATRDWLMYLRETLMGQPYLPIIGKLDAS